MDYKKVINKFKHKSDVFMYLDPPYYESYSEAYYKDGNINFEEMVSALRGSKCKWMVSINDDPYIRKLFKDYKQVKRNVVSYSSNKKDVGVRKRKESASSS